MGSDLHMGGVPSNQYWKTNGNTGTNAATNFVGTTDAQDLVVKTDNTQVAVFKTNGDVGFPSDPMFFNYEFDGSLGARKVQNDVAASVVAAFDTQANFGENVFASKFGVIDNNTTPSKNVEISVNKSTDTGELFARVAYSQTGILDLILDVREDGIIFKNGVDTYLEMTPTGRIKMNLQTYADDAAADADATLPSGALYKLTGNRAIFQKP